MKRFSFQNERKVLFSATLALLTSTSAFAAPGDCIFEETFDTKEAFGKWTIVDGNGGRTWEYLSKKASYMLDYQTGLPGDDWLISPAFQLDGDKVYELEFSMDIMSRTENLRVLLGTSTDTTTFTKVLADFPGVVKADSGTKHAKMYVKASGEFRLAFYAYSEANMHRIDIDNVRVTEVSAKGVPAHVGNATLTPGDKGALSASLAFTASTLTAADEALADDIDINIYRNGDTTAVKTFTGVAPGQELSWTDTTPQHGTNTYRIVASNAAGEGEQLELSDYIGLDAPNPVTALAARVNEQRGVSLSWSSPKGSAHNGYFDPSHLRYSVYRDGVKLGEAVADTTFTDANPVDEGQRALAYSVVAEADGEVGKAAAANSVVTGQPLALPYKESFKNQKVSAPWSLDTDIHDFGWTLMPDDEDGEFEEIMSQDGDNGLLRAESKTAYAGEQSRYVSPLLDLSTVSSPTMTFWFNYARSPWYDPDYMGQVNDNLRIQLQTDGGEWQDVENAQFFLNESSKGWTKCEVHLPKQSGSFSRIGLLATADAEDTAYRNIYVDNITIDESSYANDLALDSFTVGSRRVDVGDTLRFTASVFNRGTSAKSDYRLLVSRDGEVVATLDGVAVEPGRKQRFEYNVTATLADAQADGHVYTATIDDATDQLPDNNTSAEIAVSVRRPDVPATDGLLGEREADGKVRLTWNAVQSVPASDGEETEPVTDDFDSYTPFIIDGIGDWTLYDGDGATTLATPRIDSVYANEGLPMAFQVFNNVDAGTWTDECHDEVFEGHSGNQYLICPSANYPYENDDWLITPRLDGKSQTVSFWAHSATYDLEWIQVLASTTDTHHDSFVKISEGDHISVPERWARYDFTVPEGTRYVAVRCIYRKVMLFIDDFTYTPYGGATSGCTLRGYNVYRDGQKVNTALVESPAYTDDAADDGAHTYCVTAVYDEGESFFSNEASVDGTLTAVGTPSSDNGFTATDRFNLAGQRVGASSKGFTIERSADGKVRKAIRK